MRNREHIVPPPDATPMPANFADLVAAAKALPANDPPPERDADPVELRAGERGE